MEQILRILVSCMLLSSTSLYSSESSSSSAEAPLQGLNYIQRADLHLHTDSVTAMAYSPDGKFLASASHNGTVQVLNAMTYESVAMMLYENKHITSMAYRSDGHMLAMGTLEGDILLCDMQQGVYLEPLSAGSGSRIVRIAYSPDGQFIASGHWSGLILIWNVATKEVVHRFLGHTGMISSLAYGSDGILVSAAWDQTIRLWDTSQGNQTASISCDSLAYALAYRPDQQRVLAAVQQGLLIIDTQSAEIRSKLSLNWEGAVTSMVFSPRGQLVVGTNDTILIWDLGQIGGRSSRAAVVRVPSPYDRVASVACSGDGSHILAGFVNGHVIVLEKTRINVTDALHYAVSMVIDNSLFSHSLSKHIWFDVLRSHGDAVWRAATGSTAMRELFIDQVSQSIESRENAEYVGAPQGRISPIDFPTGYYRSLLEKILFIIATYRGV